MKGLRSHSAWGIENKLHWVLEVVFDEDRSRARADNDLAVLRRTAFNLAKANPAKGAIHGKLKRAGWERRLPRNSHDPNAIAHGPRTPP